MTLVRRRAWSQSAAASAPRAASPLPTACRPLGQTQPPGLIAGTRTEARRARLLATAPPPSPASAPPSGGARSGAPLLVLGCPLSSDSDGSPPSPPPGVGGPHHVAADEPPPAQDRQARGARPARSPERTKLRRRLALFLWRLKCTTTAVLTSSNLSRRCSSSESARRAASGCSASTTISAGARPAFAAAAVLPPPAAGADAILGGLQGRRLARDQDAPAHPRLRGVCCVSAQVSQGETSLWLLLLLISRHSQRGLAAPLSACPPPQASPGARAPRSRSGPRSTGGRARRSTARRARRARTSCLCRTWCGGRPAGWSPHPARRRRPSFASAARSLPRLRASGPSPPRPERSWRRCRRFTLTSSPRSTTRRPARPRRRLRRGACEDTRTRGIFCKVEGPLLFYGGGEGRGWDFFPAPCRRP